MPDVCLICGDASTSLLRAPCERHTLCKADLNHWFERATANENLFPPKCCGIPFTQMEYGDLLDAEVLTAYRAKVGEYSVLAKYRVYCADPKCSEFLGRGTHIMFWDIGPVVAVCQAEGCGKQTCKTCRALVVGDAKSHVCKENEEYKQFKEWARRLRYQECPACCSVVELREACNHVT